VTRFAHPSERELARLLDENGIPWMYEPHTFVLERGPDGGVVEAFTPDFFLPGANLYVELTTKHPRLMARKRRKVRRAQERHGIFVVLHEREHFERLLRTYLYSRR
jgi:hypoxanthine phosphoribosyltransferase